MTPCPTLPPKRLKFNSSPPQREPVQMCSFFRGAVKISNVKGCTSDQFGKLLVHFDMPICSEGWFTHNFCEMNGILPEKKHQRNLFACGDWALVMRHWSHLPMSIRKRWLSNRASHNTGWRGKPGIFCPSSMCFLCYTTSVQDRSIDHEHIRSWERQKTSL